MFDTSSQGNTLQARYKTTQSTDRRAMQANLGTPSFTDCQCFVLTLCLSCLFPLSMLSCVSTWLCLWFFSALCLSSPSSLFPLYHSLLLAIVGLIVLTCSLCVFLPIHSPTCSFVYAGSWSCSPPSVTVFVAVCGCG